MVRQTAKVIFLEILAGLGLLAIVLMAALAVRLSSGPVDLKVFKTDIEDALERSRAGRDVQLGQVSLEWLAGENRAVILARDLQFFNDAGEVSAQAARAEIIVDTVGLFSGKVRPIGLSLSDGWISVYQDDDGWSLAGDPIGSQSGQQVALERMDAQLLLETVNEALSDVLNTLRADADDLSLESVSFSGLDFVLATPENPERARLVDAAGQLDRGRDGIVITVSGQSSGRENAPGSFAGSLDVPGDYSRIDAELDFADWSLESVANWFPALAGSATGLPSDLKLVLGASQETGLEKVKFVANAGAGEISAPGRALNIGQMALEGTYEPQTDHLIAQLDNYDIGPASGDITLEVFEFFQPVSGARRFTLRGPVLNLDLTPAFPDIWQARELRADGTVNISTRSIDLQAMSLNIGEATLKANGDVALLEKRNPRDLPVSAQLAAEVTGTLQIDEFLQFWPVKQAPGARAYVSRILLEGLITGATARIDLKRESFAEGYLANEALTADFEATGAWARPLPDLPVLENANVVGRVTGNTLRVNFGDARLGGWEIDRGSVHYPQLSPAGADMTVTIHGRGAAQDLVRMVSDSRLQLEARTGFDPGNVSGAGEMEFTLTRPAAPNVPLSEYRYTGKGSVRSGGLASAFNGLDLIDSDAEVFLDQTGLQISGFGSLSASPLKYDWSYKFGGENTLAQLKATSIVDPDILNSFGVVGRAYLTGEVPVELEAQLDGTELRTLDAVFDVLGARLDVAEVNWIKPMGEPATATIRFDALDGVPTTIATLAAEDAAFDGAFTLAPDGRLISARIERAFLKDAADLGGTARRSEEGGLIFQLNGAFLDLSGIIPSMTQFGDSSGSASRIGDVMLDADIQRLKLREGFETTDATLSLVSSREGLQTLEVSGALPNGADMTAAYDASGLGDPSFLITSGDAGFLGSAFFGVDALEGGTLQMSGTLSTGDLPTQVRLVIEEGRLKEAPVFTQILSLASLRGVSDTLSGDGVLFSTIEVPLTISDGRINVVGARASGPALGLTANGWLRQEDRGIDIEGVLVPSFGVNSALGGLPVIGNLFVSREGEGVISLRYGVEGTLDRAQVSVNPLSAITPGVLRRIFENPEDDDVLDTPVEVPEPAPEESAEELPIPSE